MKNIFILLFTITSLSIYSQGFVNGSFENTTSTGCDYDLSIPVFNSSMEHTVMLYGSDIDIVEQGCYNLPSIPDGTKAIGLNGYLSDSTRADVINLKLTNQLVAGNHYIVSFWSFAFTNATTIYSGGIQIGLSDSSTVFGNVFETVTSLENIWTKHQIHFVASINGTYLSVRNNEDTLHYLNFVDGFNIYDCAPLPLVYSDTAVCIGEEVTLLSTGSGNITWDGGVTNGIAFTPSLGTTTYTATSDLVGECPITIDIYSSEAPTITASVSDNEVCLGDEITLSATSSVSNIIWEDAIVNNNSFLATSLGTTTYKVSSTILNCSDSASIDVTVYDSIQLATNFVDEDQGNDGSINVNIIGGTPLYYVDWDNDETGDFNDSKDLINLTGGTYTVIVKDSKGCTATKTITIEGIEAVGINGVFKNNFVAFPNPTSESFTIKIEGEYDYVLKSINGEIIEIGSALDSHTISMKNISTGIYFIDIIINGKKGIFKVIKN